MNNNLTNIFNLPPNNNDTNHHLQHPMRMSNTDLSIPSIKMNHSTHKIKKSVKYIH